MTYKTVYRYENEAEDTVCYSFSKKKATEWKQDSGDEGEITALNFADFLELERNCEVYDEREHSRIGKIELIELLAEATGI